MEKQVNQILETFRDFVTAHDYKDTPILTAYINIDPTDPANLMNASGRGIFLMRRFADVLEWRNGGNHLLATFAKYKRSIAGERYHLEDGGAHLVRRRMLTP